MADAEVKMILMDTGKIIKNNIVINDNDTETLYDDNHTTTLMVVKGTGYDYPYKQNLIAYENEKKISELIKKGMLAKGCYFIPYNRVDFFGNKINGEKSKDNINSELYSMIAYYNTYITQTFKSAVLSSVDNPAKIATLKTIMRSTLTKYIILYQVANGMIHGNLTYENILLTSQNDPLIANFAGMVKKPCKDHIKEFIWFILQMRQYINGDYNDIKRPWLAELIQPDFVKSMIDLDFNDVEDKINKASDSELDNVFNYWIQ